eukprot:3133558-Pyramimonas_sp.AAC.2
MVYVYQNSASHGDPCGSACPAGDRALTGRLLGGGCGGGGRDLHAGMGPGDELDAGAAHVERHGHAQQPLVSRARAQAARQHAQVRAPHAGGAGQEGGVDGKHGQQHAP